MSIVFLAQCHPTSHFIWILAYEIQMHYLQKNMYIFHISLGDVIISDAVQFTLISADQFTLTCISTGGPATTVTWTRDSEIAVGDTKTVLVSGETAQYTHTLTVTGRLEGLYTCTVTNNKPSSASADFTAQGSYTYSMVYTQALQNQSVMHSFIVMCMHISPVTMQPPTNVEAVQQSTTSIRVSWTPPSDATGYIIFYANGGSSNIATVSGGTTNDQLLTSLQNGDIYTLSIVATSEASLPSVSVEADMVPLGKLHSPLIRIMYF